MSVAPTNPANKSSSSSSVNSAPAPVPATPAADLGGLSLTMMYDLPMVTQFDVHQASIIASPDMESGFGGPTMTHVQVALPAFEEMRPANSPKRQSQVATDPIARASTMGGHTPVVPPPDSHAEIQPGTRLLDRYEVRRKIGQGGMSTVYEAFDEVRREKVALKVLLPHLAASPQLQERFFQEGRLSSNFSHPNIARVYDLHQTDSMVFLSMELLQGSTLREDMKRRKDRGQVYRPAEVLQLLRDVCEALKVVHANKIVHRDLKPENLWLCLDGTLKIMDFGIARDVLGTKFTYDGRGSGTPYYIAPEQMASSPLLDGRADQYSLAIIAYELLTGQLPQGAVAPPHLKNPAVPQKMSRAIFRALSSEPSHRYPSIEGFFEAVKFRTHTPRWIKAAVWLVVVSLFSSSGFAFYKWGMPYFRPASESPIWAEIGAQRVTENQPLTFVVRHPNGSYGDDQLRFELLSDAPEGAKIDAQTGEFTWTPTEQQGPREYEFGIMSLLTKENDKTAVVTHRFSVSVQENVDAPLFETPDAIDIEEHQEWSTTIAAQDPNVPAFGLVYSLPLDAPEGLSIDSKTGALSWKPTERQAPAKYDVKVKVRIDHEEQAVEREIPVSIAVKEVLDAPVFTAAEPSEMSEGQAFTFLSSARDPNVPTIDFFYALGSAPAGMSIDPRSGQVQWTPNEQDGGKEFSVVVQACLQSDDGRTVTLSEQPFALKVNEKLESPILHKMGVVNVQAGQQMEVQVGVTDPNDPPVEFVYSLGPSAPSGMQMERTTGVIRWTPREDAESQQFEIPVLVHPKGGEEAMAQDMLTVRLTKKPPQKDPKATTRVAPRPQPRPSGSTGGGTGGGGQSCPNNGRTGSGNCEKNGGLAELKPILDVIVPVITDGERARRNPPADDDRRVAPNPPSGSPGNPPPQNPPRRRIPVQPSPRIGGNHQLPPHVAPALELLRRARGRR